MSNQKLQKKIFFLSISKFEPMKKEIIIISWFLNGSSSFNMKESEKMKQKIWKFSFVKKNQQI